MDRILERLREAVLGSPWQGRLWLVGGAVRDGLLGLKAGPDLDIVVEGDAGEAVQFLVHSGVADGPPVLFPRFGTAMLRVGGVPVDFVTARKEAYEPDSRKPQVEPASLLEDALRRDFTVNALLRSVSDGDLADPLGQGLADLKARILRTPLDAETTFRDDPLRMLRAVRFRWQLGFEFAPGLAEAIQSQANRLRVISAERIRDEWVKTLLNPAPDRAMADQKELGLLAEFAPELLDMVGVEQGSDHHLDVWDHTLLALHNTTSPDLLTRLAVVFHDVGKPATRTVEADGRTRFFGHERVGAEIATRVLDRLRFANDDTEAVAKLVRNHMRLSSAPTLTDSGARRLIRDLDSLVPHFLDMVEADASALRPGVRRLDLAAVRRKLAEIAAQTPASRLASPLSGDEIMALTDLPPGAEVGRIKALLLEEVLEGRLAPGDAEGARAFVLRTLAAATPLDPQTSGNQEDS